MSPNAPELHLGIKQVKRSNLNSLLYPSHTHRSHAHSFSKYFQALNVRRGSREETRGTDHLLKFNTFIFHENQVFISHFILPS